MAVSQVSGDGDIKTCRSDRGLLPVRPLALDRQLRPSLRLHIRLPNLVRNHAFRHIWNLRKKKKVDIVVDLSSILHFHFCWSNSTLLRHTNP